MPSVSSPTPDASTTNKGKVQLAGDLGGTAAAPTVRNVTYNPYKFNVYRAAANTLSAGNNIIIFDTKRFDTGTNYSTSTGRFTAPVAGFYQFNARTAFNLSSSSIVWLAVFLNGVEYTRANRVDNVTGAPEQAWSETMQLAVGDYVQISAALASGTATGLETQPNAGEYLNSFSGFLVSTT